MDEIIDLRSDTVTRPTPQMREAMMAAEVGDDVYGEDPTVNLLEEEVARILGKEAAVFTPSGTMANQIAILLHTRPGDSVLCEESSHTFLYEAGAGAALAGVQFDIIPFAEELSSEAIQSRYRPDGLHEARSSLIIVENTHNRGRGRALTSRDIHRITALAAKLHLRSHCDGARIWNAAVATGDTEAKLAAGFETVAVCFSKGLGAPVGSAIAGSKAAMEQARKFRKRLGGGMRQAGFLAAAALYGLRHHRTRLADDHRRAQALADGLLGLADRGAAIRVEMPERATNMVYWRSDASAELMRSLRERGVLMNAVGNGLVRAVTHLDISDAQIERALSIFRDALSSRD